MKLAASVWVLLVFLQAACGDDEPGGAPDAITVEGAAQKGPFVLGSSVQVAMVDDAGNPTGAVFNASTRNDLGEFELVMSSFGSVEIITTGFYFNEYTGDLSGSNITLRALGRIESSGMQRVYINLVTHLAEARAKELLSQGTSFDAAVAQAERELRAALPIVHPAEASAGAGITMNVLGGDSADNEYLLAVSCVLSRAAALEATSDREVDAKLQELVNTIALDLEADGALDQALVDRIDYAERTLAPGVCETNLSAWLDEQGSQAQVPDSQQAIDSDSDGEPNASDADDDGDGIDDGEDPDPVTPCVDFCDGTCRDLYNDTANCGSCGAGCDPAQADTCVEGGCACGGGELCAGTETSFCCESRCLDLTSGEPGPEGGTLHCGECGHPCDPLAGDRCEDGECRCGGGPACAGTPEDQCCMGRCVDTTSNLDHCGGCEPPHLYECRRAGNTACVDGSCVCGDGPGCDGAAGETCCPGVGCVLGGDCRNVCDPPCDEGTNCCDGTCVDFATDLDNCGSCGNRCFRGSCVDSVCLDGAVCVPGETESQDCGGGLSQTRTCGADGTWGAWGLCEGGGVCTPGETESLSCGNCGSQSRTCDELGQWGAWGACSGEGACAPGATDTLVCGNCGSQARTCDDSCVWSAWGACEGEGECVPNSWSAPQACGNCGTQTRYCAGQCMWDPWGLCINQGACSPGSTSAPQACGVCGSQTSTCDQFCGWVPGPCNDPCA